MTSNVPLLQGLAVDLRPMFKEQANQSLREQVAAQKQRDAADKRMEQLMGLIKIDPNATPHEYYQQNNQKIAADWMKGAQDAYAQDKTMINTPSATSSALKAQSEIILNNTASHALLNDQTLSTKGEYQIDPELSMIVASGGDIGTWVKQKTNGATDKYQPGMGLILIPNHQKAWADVSKGVGLITTDSSKKWDQSPDFIDVTSTTTMDEKALKANIGQYWLSHPEWQKEYPNVEDFYASFSPDKTETHKYVNIAKGNYGNTFNFGGGYGNDAFKLKPDAPDYFSVNSVSGVGNNPTWDLPGKKAFTDKDGTTPFDMKALKGSYQGIITTPDANGKPIATHIAVLVPEHTGKDPRPEFNTIDIKIPAQTVFIPVDQEVANDFNSKTQTKTKSGVDLPGWHYKDMSKKSAAPKDKTAKSSYKPKKEVANQLKDLFAN